MTVERWPAADWRRVIVFTHRWLGIAGCLLFVAWFASGIVMMYARMPRLTPAERLARLAPLEFASARVSPAAAARRLGLVPQRVRATMIDGRPAYRMLEEGRWVAIFADTGERLESFTPERATEQARRFAPGDARRLRYDARLTQPDQWTLEDRALLPMHRIEAGDPAGTVLYVSDVSGDVALKTTARERRLAYAGAVVHWLYFTPLRKHSTVWARSIIGLSVAGSVLCLLGLVWGGYVGLRSPYSGWMRWHHYAGLVFGAFTFTWVFSGLLSMDPVAWQPGNAPTRAEEEAFAGGPLRLDGVGVDAFRVAPDPARGAAREIEIVQFRGDTRLVVDNRPGVPIGLERLLAAARAVVPGAGVEEATVIEEYDAYYYDRLRELPLPALRVRFADRQATWLYIDPARGAIVRKEQRRSRLNRWLYHGLHSLDLPWLYARRPLWDVAVILLSLGGMASAITAIAPAWRRLRRRGRHLLYLARSWRGTDARSRP